MKLPCKSCGTHFKEDFEDTLVCDFWDVLSKEAPKETKKEIWEAFFFLDVDKIYLETGMSLSMTLRENEVTGVVWKDVPGYEELSDTEKKDLQKRCASCSPEARKKIDKILEPYKVNK